MYVRGEINQKKVLTTRGLILEGGDFKENLITGNDVRTTSNRVVCDDVTKIYF